MRQCLIFPSALHRVKRSEYIFYLVWKLWEKAGIPKGNGESIELALAGPHQKSSIPRYPAQEFLRFGSHSRWMVPALVDTQINQDTFFL